LDTIDSDLCLPLDTDTAFCQVRESDIGSVGTNSHFFFQNDKFVSANGEFDSAEFETIRDIFVQRYGQPHNFQRQVVRNNAGGIFQNETITWVGKKVTIFFTKYGTTVTHGAFDVSLNSYNAESERRDNAKKKKAANAL
jgi:hypothetical protein